MQKSTLHGVVIRTLKGDPASAVSERVVIFECAATMRTKRESEQDQTLHVCYILDRLPIVLVAIIKLTTENDCVPKHDRIDIRHFLGSRL